MDSPTEISPDQQKAQELCEETGVPLWGAYRIVRGEITLDQLLRTMLRKEQFEKLQQQDGFDSDLAGHVASGSLPKWRAKVLQEMRSAGRTRFSQDRVSVAGSQKLALSIWKFGETRWDTGTIKKSRAYEFSFQEARRKQCKVQKHDVKAVCHPADLSFVELACGLDKTVARQRLGASKERKDRYRPTDEQLSHLKTLGKPVYWLFRDGTQVYGKVFAFGRWDVDLTLAGGVTVTVFFHALHAGTDRNIGSPPKQ